MNETRVVFNLDYTKHYVMTNPELAFGSETWALTNTDMASSEAQQIFRRPVGVSRRDHLRNEVNSKWLCSQWGRSLKLLNTTLLTNSSFPHHIANLPWLGCG
jgi:hypothetical protein